MNKHRSLREARAIVERLLQERSAEMTGVDFVLAEDCRTVMLYIDIVEEDDALAVYFDLAPGEVFDRQRHAADFVTPPALN
jgi:hypothetical protein